MTGARCLVTSVAQLGGGAGVHDQAHDPDRGIFGNTWCLLNNRSPRRPGPAPGIRARGPRAQHRHVAAVAHQLGSTSAEFIRRGMPVAPTLEIRRGYPFNVMVTQVVIFPCPYRGEPRMSSRRPKLSPAMLKGLWPATSTRHSPRTRSTTARCIGEAIEMWPLLVQMLRTFLDVDRAFYAWRRQAGEAAAGTRNGTGKESRNA